MGFSIGYLPWCCGSGFLTLSRPAPIFLSEGARTRIEGVPRRSPALLATTANHPAGFTDYWYERMATVREILDAAQALPPSERAQLIYALWGTISPDDWGPPSDDWIAEANRRSEAFDAGQMTASPWSEVRQRARRQARLDD
jgi:putative addiction module component (TIGR02574 family)